MHTYTIDPETLLPHGAVRTRIENGALCLTATRTLNTRFQNHDTPVQSYLRLPEKLHVPFTLRIRVTLDDQALYILIGRGHVAFATGLTENRPITDILGGDYKPRARGFDNGLSLGRPTALEITYTAAAMWVRVDGELRCLAQKEPYQKALKKGECADAFAAGFDAALACDKETTLTVYELSVTEYDDDAPAAPPRDEVRPLLFSPGGLCPGPTSTLEECVQALPDDLRDGLLKTDEYLRTGCGPELKFTRKIEGRFPCCKLTYTAPHKLSYRVQISGSYLRHSLGWLWTREDRQGSDRTVEWLQTMAESDAAQADALFYKMKDCCGCSKAPEQCMNRSPYAFAGQKKLSCQGRFHFKGRADAFDDVRRSVEACREMLRRNENDGSKT